jgi:hypothetical protein
MGEGSDLMETKTEDFKAGEQHGYKIVCMMLQGFIDSAWDPGRKGLAQGFMESIEERIAPAALAEPTIKDEVPSLRQG